jgi:hemerythrin
MKWKKHYSIGIPSVDGQHKQLFRIIEELENTMAQQVSESAFAEVLAKLDIYVIRHFTLEEQLMKKTNYPNLHQQQEEHGKLITQLTEIKKVLATTGVEDELAVKLYNELSDWIKSHVTELDKEFGYYYIGQQNRTNRVSG